MCRVRRCGWHLGWRVSEGRRQSHRCKGQRAAQEAELLTTASPPLHNRGMARRPGPQRVERVLQLSQMLQLRRPQQLAVCSVHIKCSHFGTGRVQSAAGVTCAVVQQGGY